MIHIAWGLFCGDGSRDFGPRLLLPVQPAHHSGLDSIRPNLVTLFARMEQIRHHFASQRPVRLEHFRTDVLEKHRLIVCVGFDDRIGRLVLLAKLIVWLFTSWEDGQHENLRVRALCLQLIEDQFHPVGCVLGSALINSTIQFLLFATLMTRVVRADHQHDHFWIEPIKISVIEAPQHMLRPVPTDAKIGRAEWSPLLLPDRLPLT